MSTKNAEIITKGRFVIGTVIESDEGYLFIPSQKASYNGLKLAKGNRENIDKYIESKFKNYNSYDPDEILEPFNKSIKDLWESEEEEEG